MWDEQTVWATGSEGVVLRSADGGESWTPAGPPGTELLDFRDVELLDADTVLVMSVGTLGDSRIYKSSDRGASWRQVYARGEEGAFFNGLAFWNATSGLLIGDPVDGRLFVIRTDDGGDSWRPAGETPRPPLAEGEYGFAASGTGIAVVGRTKAWVATGGVAARVFSSPDGGRRWNVVETPIGAGTPSSGIFSLAMRDEQRGVAVGGDYEDPASDRGNAAWTADGGRTWSPAETGGQMSQKAAAVYLGAGRYLAAGRLGLAYSGDDGRSWRSFSDEPFYAASYHRPSGVGWLVGPEGRVARFSVEP